MCDFRLQSLEKKILIEAGETPAVVYEMKKQVDSFREKLEVWPKYYVAIQWHNNANSQRGCFLSMTTKHQLSNCVLGYLFSWNLKQFDDVFLRKSLVLVLISGI